ncbi:A24 family peptidase [Desulfotruncus alcoholivorax]|uniref:A24 family peptidase n=1 Tax=Desulfotruncus alcoholivorax TaxID=265477 RepID=UPI0003F79215|nr:A24 family peptidase [Desulfotruncus alcoholivorax]
MLNFYSAGLTPADIFLVIILLVCCYTDLRIQKIYNAVLFPAIVVAFAFNILQYGPEGILISLKGLLLGIALLLIPFAANGIGAGDVKLLGTIGAIKGPEFVLFVFFAAAITGGVISVYLLARRGRLLVTLKKIFYSAVNKLLNIPVKFDFAKLEVAANGEAFPYGVAIGLGTFGVYLLGWLGCVTL